MSNQIVISSGAKVRNLSGVLTATSGIVDSVGYGTPNGVATLDALGKVPLSQLPASVVTYLGTWNAATNTPNLTNGVGDTGDLYICNVAGTVNFGAGPITFAAGDWVIYSGTEWQKSAGASGTVTSVALTESGDALTITGSPITTSGTINIGFAGTGLQYIKGDGTLATFPTTIDQAKRLITEVYNSTGATLTKGTVVYINGGQGNLPTVTKAQANNDANSAQTYGVVQDDITNMNNGFVVVLGSLTDLDTSAYVVGTQLYLSGTTAGAWTSTKPSAPIHLVYVAIVVRSHPTQGVVEVRIQNGYELEEIHDVAISAPVNNQGIFYNSSNDLWENKSIATALGYTPANDALVVHLAGTETITGVKNFDVGLTLKDGIYPTPSTGYIGLASNGDGLTILTKSGATVYNHNIQFQASSNDYNFPAITGIMAMLEGSQTFTGSKTFSATTLLNTIYVDGVSYLKHQTSTSYISGYTTFSAKANGVIEYYFPTSFKSILDFNDAADYTYTFPASSGTLALTSNLSSYVPYSGATSNVNLGTYNITTTGNVNAANFVGSQSAVLGAGTLGGTLALFPYATYTTNDGYLNIVASSTTKLNLIFGQGSSVYKTAIFDVAGLTNSVNRTYTLPDASGTLVLGTGTTNYLPKFTGASTLGDSVIQEVSGNIGIGGSPSGSYKFEVTGTGRFTGNVYWSTSGNGFMYAGNTTKKFAYASQTNNVLYSGGTDGFGINNAADSLRLFTITDTGNVGIGTTTPAELLEVFGKGRFSIYGTAGINETLKLVSNANYNADRGVKMGFYVPAGTNSEQLGAEIGSATSASTSSYLFFSTTNSGTTAERMRIGSDGTIGIARANSTDTRLIIKGIGTTSATYALTVQDSSSNNLFYLREDGLIYTGLKGASPYNNTTASAANMHVNAGGVLYRSTASSQRFKENIIDWDGNGLDTILSLKPKTFTYKEDYYSCPDRQFLGLIAEEVAEVSSFLADFENEDGTGQVENVRYANIVVPLIKAIQELSAKVSALENKS